MERNRIKIFVTGGYGFIGSNFIRLVLATHPDARILNFDKLTYSGNLENLTDIKTHEHYEFIKGDIADAKAVTKVFKTFKPTHVINFAAETHVDRSIHESSKEFLRTNAEGVRVLLEVIKAHPVKKFVQVSTDEVYGSLSLTSQKRFTEDTSLTPNSPYAASKAAGDLLCRAYYQTWQLPIVITHSSNNFGPYQFPEKLVPFFITRILRDKTLPLYGDGKHIRDWLYVEDHCRALWLCLTKGTPGKRYNIGGDNEYSNVEIAKKILAFFKKGLDSIEYVADRPGHDRRYGLDSSKIKRELGWQPRYSFANALKSTLEWYLNNQSWLKKLEQKEKSFNPHIYKP